FLMAKEQAAYISVTIDAAPEPGIRWPHLPEYEADIGHPCAPMTESQQVYVRDYSNGIVVTNPSSSSAHVFTLPEGEFRDLHDVPVFDSILPLPPLTGKVLLSAEPRCP